MTSTLKIVTAALVPLMAFAAGPAPERPVFRLSVSDAIQIALTPEGNFRMQLAAEQVKQAEARAGQARAALLPALDGYVSGSNRTANLASLGFPTDIEVAGYRFPTAVGPYTVLDARAAVSQSVLNLSSIQNFKAARVGVQAATADGAHTREQVAAQVSRAYLEAVRADASLEAINANITLAEAIVKQTEAVRAAGMGTGIETTRALVELSNAQQRRLIAENERERAYLQLKRAAGLNLDARVELTDTLKFLRTDEAVLKDAVETALSSRADLRAQIRREEEARRSSSAVSLERVPSISTFADYGTVGTGISNSLPTRAVGVTVTVPIFDGGRRDARRAEAGSKYREQRVRTNELREQIQLEVRLAVQRLKATEQQVSIAERVLLLAEDELKQARERYRAGVTGSLEVTTAQTNVERARDNRINAVFNCNQARLDLGEAMGTVRVLLPASNEIGDGRQGG